MKIFTIFCLAPLLASNPDFTELKPVRKVNSTGILGDIESHLNANNPYTASSQSSQIWQKEHAVHEGTHGINSIVRAQSSKHNGVYVLENRSLRFNEPKIYIHDVVKNIPKSLKGKSFTANLDAAHIKEWDYHPLYILDEWTAYTHGALYYHELKQLNHWNEVPRNAIDLTFFAFALLKTCPDDYIDKEKLKDFIKWNAERVLGLLYYSDRMIEQVAIFKFSEDCAELRKFVISVYGQEWYNKQIGER